MNALLQSENPTLKKIILGPDLAPGQCCAIVEFIITKKKVLIIDKSRAAINENCNVLGMGVAVKVNVSIFALSVFSLSFIPTPNFCSSSMTNKPKSRNITSLLTSRCVPIMMSTFPSARFCRGSVCCFLVLKRFVLIQH